MVHLMTKKLKGGSTQGTLGCVDLDTVILQVAEDFAEVVEVHIQVLAGDQDECKATKNLVHEALEGLAAFLRPKVIRVNSNSPKGVVTAVLGMSAGSTGIW